MTENKVKLSDGEWSARILNTGVCEILDPKGDRRAMFANAQIMAVHYAILIEENDRLRAEVPL